jgi:hypothetical protein
MCECVRVGFGSCWIRTRALDLGERRDPSLYQRKGLWPEAVHWRLGPRRNFSSMAIWSDR